MHFRCVKCIEHSWLFQMIWCSPASPALPVNPLPMLSPSTSPEGSLLPVPLTNHIPRFCAKCFPACGSDRFDPDPLWLITHRIRPNDCFITSSWILSFLSIFANRYILSCPVLSVRRYWSNAIYPLCRPLSHAHTRASSYTYTDMDAPCTFVRV